MPAVADIARRVPFALRVAPRIAPRVKGLPPVLGAAVLAAVCVLPAAAQQPLPRIWESPAARTVQTLGLAQVEVSWHRPAVRGREIWGELVPYGEVWRAGANDNTTVTLSHDATVEGQPLAAGTYGLHMLPSEGDWTVIFSKNATSWGSYSYAQAEDALRVSVTPEAAPHQEWLLFEFDELTRDAGRVVLRWDELAVPVRLAFPTDELMLAHIRDVHLRGIPGFRWQGWHEAAAWSLGRGMHLEQGLAWSEQSLSRGRNSTNLTTHAGLLSALGRDDESAAALKEAVALATGEAELNALGYQLLQAGRTDAAVAAFERNVVQHPRSWNAHDSLGEARAAAGDVDGAVESYEQALALVEDPEQRLRIEGVLAKLKAR